MKIPVSAFETGGKIKGTTVAELGNRNNPLDMIVYKKGGKDYLLLANSARGVMKITTEGLANAEGITAALTGFMSETRVLDPGRARLGLLGPTRLGSELAGVARSASSCSHAPTP